MHSRFPRNPARRGPPHAAMFRSTIVIPVALAIGLAALADGELAIPGLICTLSGHGDAVYSVVFASDGRQIVTCSFDKTVRLWDAVTGRELRVFGGGQGHQNYVLSL